MPSLAERLQVLARAPVASAAEILAAALDHCEDDECAPISRCLLDLRQVTGLQAVVRNLHRLDQENEQPVKTSRVSFFKPAERALQNGDRQTILNVINLALIRQDWRLISLLTRFLESRHDGVPGRAASALLALVVAKVGENGRSAPTPPVAAAIDSALAGAADGYRRHRLDDVLLAMAIAAMRPGPKLGAILSDEDHPACRALRGIVEHTDRPLVRRNLINWLSHESLGRQVLRWLYKLSGPQQFSDLLEKGHLLLNPRRKIVLRQVDRPGRCLPGVPTAAGLPAVCQAKLPGYLTSLGLSETQCVTRLTELAGLPSPVARMRAAAMLSGYRSPEARLALERFARDADPAVAGIAAACVLADPAGFSPEVLCDLEQSGRGRSARRATLLMARGDVKQFFQRWLLLSPVERIAVALHLAAVYGEDLIAGLNSKLMGVDHDERLAAIALVRRLGFVVELEAEIIEQTTGPDGRVASASVAALAAGRTDLACEALQAALRHTDGRVRANALESLDQQLVGTADGQTETDLFRALSDSRHNRLRANALRALLRRDAAEAAPHICRMLQDDDPLHRVSAIWAARRSRDAAVITELKFLARADSLEPVRIRAAAAVRIVEHRAVRGGTVAPMAGADFR